MGIVSRHIATDSPYNGLCPNVLNVPHQTVMNAKASASNAVFTTQNIFTSATKNISFAPGTQPDYARNVVAVVVPNTASSSLYSVGSVIIYGRDLYGSTRSESFALTALNTVSSGLRGSVNFASLDSVSYTNVQLHTNSSSAGSAVSAYVGVGQKLGLPISLISTDAVFNVVLGTAEQRTSSGANSTNNQYTVVTGGYEVNGISLSSAYASGTLLQVGYANLGFRAPVGSY